MTWSWALVVLYCLSTLTSASFPRHQRKCTFEGYYDANADTLQPCPGALPCEAGFYCTGGQRLLCPLGTFGAETKLRTRDCTGICPAGFYCPEGTSSPIECKGADVYCPIGSGAPLVVPEGYYSVGQAWRRRDRIAPCEVGYYCRLGTKYKCPAGRYGATTALKTAKCTDDCPAGFFCVEGSITPVICPGGVYGTRTGEIDPACSGLCQEGYYCPPGSISSTERLCGTGKYCPQGSAEPQPVVPGSYVLNGDSQIAGEQHTCPIGSYCTSVDGAVDLCPGGTFGDTDGLMTARCSGLCAPGYYCPKGSTSRTSNVCGSANVYCPEGSAVPTTVLPGYYTVGKLSVPGRDQNEEDVTIRFAQHKCEPGYYCIDGVRYPCPGGRFGDSFALTTPECSGQCQEGYYCPPQSIVATAQLCGGSQFYCPVGSALPTPVSKGYCTVGTSDPTIRTTQRRAKPGEYAWMGSCYPCPAGRYGDTDGETNPQCTSLCMEGYYCPPGSSSPTEKECGGAHVYCPVGSKAPIPVATGYYTSIGLQEQCPPGFFRDMTTTASAFLDIATGRSTTTVNYGDALYPLAKCVKCPTGKFKPSFGDAYADCVACPEFTTTSTIDRRSCQCFRLSGGAAFDSTTMQLYFDIPTLSCVLKPLGWIPSDLLTAQNSIFTRSRQIPCERGYACVGGIRTPCPAGTYGDLMMETRVATCAGSCSPGFYCPLASTNSTAVSCGDASLYCPRGSRVPVPVTSGYYTIRSTPVITGLKTPSRYYASTQSYDSLNASTNAMIRDAQQRCEVGYYCIQGSKFICPAGRYGNQLGEVSPQCTGPCKRGFYCPAGSISPTQHSCGSYNIKDPNSQICRTGSALPTLVLPGFYSVGGDPLQNSTRFYQRPCEKGYYCVKGIKYQCPAGTYGATTALTSPQCSGQCHAGYYCPSYPYPPSTSATQLECGDSTVYCPQGTGNRPLFVTSGFYSVGAGDDTGDARNTTRIAQVPCPRGFYCRNGIKIQCPEGTYGDREGLTSTQCSGWCPAGYFCPKGTIVYETNPCPAATFAIAGSAQCMDCGGTSATQGGAPAAMFSLVSDTFKKTPCVDKRSCCFFG